MTVQPRLQCREIKSQSLGLKEPVGFEAVGGNPSLTGELVGKTHRVLEHAHPPPTWESAPEGLNFLMGSGGND